jgi:predicted CxxxxCH...CXXCH cytochrome family protein
MTRGEGRRGRFEDLERTRSRGVTAACALGWVALALGGCGVLEDAPDATGRTPAAHAQAARSSALTSGVTCEDSGVHQTHIEKFACATCHPCGKFGFDQPYTFPSGQTSTAGGTITRGDPTTCTVACHFPKGAPQHSISWSSPVPLACTSCHDVSTFPAEHPTVAADAPRTLCEGCHDMAAHMDGQVVLIRHGSEWMQKDKPGFHAYSANQGLAPCQDCHGRELMGGAANVSCDSCHDGTLAPLWGTCTTCHGDPQNRTGAPPRATWGNNEVADTTNVRIGAHTVHMTGSAIAPPFDCGVCHVKPSSAFSDGHIDAATVADVFFAGTATIGVPVPPAWNRSTATCSNTYCHGATMTGGTLTSPVWTTVDGSQAACGTCHGLPPGPPHPGVSSDLAGCSMCHEVTIRNGTIIPPSEGGKHMDGVSQTSGHGPNWMIQSSLEFHAYSANRSLAGCTPCHGSDLTGGKVGVGCADCHDGAQANLWGSCTMCHGATNNLTGAPPRATWGNNNPSGRTNIRIGAHTRHVSGNTISTPFVCPVCHVTPTDVLDPVHVDGPSATVTFGGIAVQGGASPSWNEATARCGASYCHGGTIGGGSNANPSWVTTKTGLACDACHGSGMSSPRPRTGKHVPLHNSVLLKCSNCHFGVTQDIATLQPAVVDKVRHVNGAKDVLFGSTYDGRAVSGTFEPDVLSPTGERGRCTVSCHANIGIPEPQYWYPAQTAARASASTAKRLRTTGQ